MKKFLLMALLALQAGFASAQETLELESTTVAPGKSVTAEVNLINTAVYGGMQFDVNVPEGVTVTAENGERAGDQTLTCKKRKSCAYDAYNCFRVLQINTDEFEAYEGESGGSIITLTFDVASSVAEGEYTVYLTDVVFCDENSEGPEFDVLTGTLTVSKTTRINGIEGENAYSKYDLQGRRTNAKTGVLVINGKKQIVK